MEEHINLILFSFITKNKPTNFVALPFYTCEEGKKNKFNKIQLAQRSLINVIGSTLYIKLD